MIMLGLLILALTTKDIMQRELFAALAIVVGAVISRSLSNPIKENRN